MQGLALPKNVPDTSPYRPLRAHHFWGVGIAAVAEDLESEGLMAEEVQAVQQQVGVWLPHGARLGAAWPRPVL